MTVKLFFLDMEGTIYEKRTIRLQNGDTRVHHSLWSQLMHRLGEEAVNADTRSFQKWETGEYDSYFDWVNESVRILRDNGLDQELFERSIQTIQYNPGIEETVGKLHDRGIRTAIVSGGFYNHARRCQVDLGITHAFAAVDLFWDESGQLAHWNMLPSDYEGKIDFVQLLRREYGLKQRECAFVGDGKTTSTLLAKRGCPSRMTPIPRYEPRAITRSIPLISSGNTSPDPGPGSRQEPGLDQSGIRLSPGSGGRSRRSKPRGLILRKRSHGNPVTVNVR